MKKNRLAKVQQKQALNDIVINKFAEKLEKKTNEGKLDEEVF